MLVVVGGQGRKVGKSAVVAALIRALPEAGWTAIKISAHAHGASGGYELREETSPSATDSGRCLRAGAVRAFWLHGPPESLGDSVPQLTRLIAAARNTIIESNSVLDYLSPDLYLLVVAPGNADWKGSARRHLDRADAFIISGPGSSTSAPLLPRNKPRFLVAAPDYHSEALAEFVAARLTRRNRSAG